MLNKKNVYLLCFFLPLSVMAGCMICYGVQPFGDNSLVIVDGLHQYMPFFSVLYDKLKSGESLLYSFRIGLGVNFLSLFAYYLSSPLNLFILLFKKTQLNMAVSLLIVIKIALSGLTAGIYFLQKRGVPDLSVVAAACLYALNSYMTGYSWNVMWLDALMVFPLIMLGIERLLEKKDGRLYCLALFYALFCNYYIAYMICIFCVLWFLLLPFKNIKQFIGRGLAFAFYSLLAGGMAAVLLIPAYLGIKQTASGSAMFLPSHGWETGFADLLTRQFDLASPISHDNFDGNINLYFGTAVVFTAFLYMLNTEISLLKKLKKAILLTFLYVSFNEIILNFIWHGFHNQYGIPNRFSFLFGFVLIGMFVEVMNHSDAIKNWQAVAASAGGIVLLYISRFYAGEPLEDVIYGIVGMLFVCYGMFLLLMVISRRRKIWHLRLFCAAAIIEICVTAFVGYGSIGQIRVGKFFSGTEDMEKAVSALSDGTFYRSELAEARFVDESSWHRMYGVSLFGSTAMNDMVELMDSLGFYTGCNEYLYKGSNPVTDMMLDVRYLFCRKGDRRNTSFVYKKDYGQFSVYENPVQGLSVGYGADMTIEDWACDSAYPFRVLNDFAEKGYRIDQVFRIFGIQDPVTKGCTVTRTNEGEFHFFFEERSEDNLVFTIPMMKTEEHLYLFYDGTQVENARIEVDGAGVIYGDKDATMLDVGRVDAGSTVVVRFQLKGETEDGYIRLSAAALDEEKFAALSESMASRAFHVTAWSEDHMEGRVRTRGDQVLFFSIPYDEGWRILVDGEEEDSWFVGNAFLALEPEEGEHEISMTFVPPGFIAGRRISLICLVIFILICLAARRKKRLQPQSSQGNISLKQILSEQAPQADGEGQESSGDTQET